jgi:phage-related baseplate assembly protein
MARPLEDLTTPMTVDEVKASMYDVLARLGAETTSWKPGAPTRTFIAIAAVLISALTYLVAAIARSGSITLSSGAWLTLVAWWKFRVARIEQTFAAGDVTLTNAGGGMYSWDVGELVVQNSTTGALYRNVSSVSLSPTSTATVQVRAVEAGAGSTSTAGQIDALVTTATGVTCTNPGTLVGLDEEGDEALRQRCIDKLDTLSIKGPRGAYVYWAKSATVPWGDEDGSPVSTSRAWSSNSSPNGQVRVVAASANGPVTGDVTDPTTDLGAIAAAIEEHVRPDGVTVTVESASAVTVNVTYEVWAYSASGIDTDTLKAQISTALTALMARQPIGGNIIPPATNGKLYVDTIRGAIAAANDGIFRVVVSAPGSDVALNLGSSPAQVPVIGSVTGTVHWVAS